MHVVDNSYLVDHRIGEYISAIWPFNSFPQARNLALYLSGFLRRTKVKLIIDASAGTSEGLTLEAFRYQEAVQSQY